MSELPMNRRPLLTQLTLTLNTYEIDFSGVLGYGGHDTTRWAKPLKRHEGLERTCA